MRAIAVPFDGLFEVRTPSLIAWPARSDLLVGRRRTLSAGDEVVSLAVVGDAGVGTGVGVRDDSGAGVGSAGVTEADALDAAEVPAELVAVTVKVYRVPLARPGMVHEVEEVVQVAPPGEAMAV